MHETYKPPVRIWLFRSNYSTTTRILARTLQEASEKVYLMNSNLFPKIEYDFFKTYPLIRELMG